MSYMNFFIYVIYESTNMYFRCDFNCSQTTLLFWFLRFYSEVYSSAYRIKHSDFTILLDCYIYIYIYINIYIYIYIYIYTYLVL